MSNLIVIAKITAKENHAEEVKTALLALAEPTLQEDGCIQYDCHQDNGNPHVFYFYEIWESADHLQAHGQSDHIKSMRIATEGMIVGRELNTMHKL